VVFLSAVCSEGTVSRYTCPPTLVFILNLDTRWLHTPGALPPRKNPGAHWIGGLVGPRVDLRRKKTFVPGGYRPPVPRLVQIFSAPTDLYLIYIPVSPTNVTPEYLALSMFLADTVHVIEHRSYSLTQNSTKSELSMSTIFILLSVWYFLLSVPRCLEACESLLLDLVSGSWHLRTRAGNVAACWENRRLCVRYYLSVRT
jgi:hypothetical protein